MARNTVKSIFQKKQDQRACDKEDTTSSSSSSSGSSSSSSSSSSSRRRSVGRPTAPEEEGEGTNVEEPNSKSNSNRHLLLILRRHSAIFRHRRFNRRGFRSCCFCCFCCCSCTCADSILQKSVTPSKTAAQDPMVSNPTLEEVRSWSESFDRLMKCSAGRELFRQFLQCEYSEENILFWVACEELKKELNPETVEEKARIIYENYVSILSPREVSLDSKVRDLVDSKMNRPTANTFDEAQLQIYTLMHRDSYPRFLTSTVYREVAQLTPPSSKTTLSSH